MRGRGEVLFGTGQCEDHAKTTALIKMNYHAAVSLSGTPGIRGAGEGEGWEKEMQCKKG